MKPLFKIVMIVPAICISAQSMAAMSATDSSLEIINSLTIDDFDSQGNNVLLRSTDKVKSFGNLPNVYVNIQGNHVAINKQGALYPDQCVSFVKAITNSSRVTGNWIRGDRVTANTYLPKGTIIATFKSNGKYGAVPNSPYQYGHTAMVMGKRGNGILVMDQNFVPNKVAFHYLPFDSNNRHDHTKSAEAYHVVN